MECPELHKVIFLFLYLYRMFWPNLLNHICWILWEMPRPPQKLNAWQTPPHREGHQTISPKIVFWWKLHEMYRTTWNSCFPIPTTPQKVGWWSPMHKIMQCQAQSELTPSFPMGLRVSNIRFVCRSGHFTQFLENMFSLKLDLTPPPHHMRDGSSEHDFSVQNDYFMHFLPKDILVSWPWPALMKAWSWWTQVLCTDLDLLFSS